MPQGGIISPLLFNVLMADIEKHPMVQYSEYADDVAIYAIHEDSKELLRIMQEALNMFVDWSKRWGLNINISKTKAKTFSRVQIEDDVLMLERQLVENVISHRFLGVTFDGPIVKWKQHIDKIVQKCTPFVSVLKSKTHCSWGSDQKSLLTLYNAFICSRIDYCSFIYQSASKVNL